MMMKSNQKKFNIISIILILLAVVCSTLSLVFILIRPKSAETIFEETKHSVVELKASKGEEIVSYGSAVFIDEEGTLISNAHVVCYKQSGVYYQLETFEIRFCFEEDYRSVTLEKYDLKLDVSILKLKDTNCNFKSLHTDKSELITGQKVYAVGNGMNHGIGINEGIVSLPKVNIEYDGYTREVIQCDLAINDGNSGGALLDEKCNLRGITTFRLLDDYGNVIYGTCYSLPISNVLDFLNS